MRSAPSRWRRPGAVLVAVSMAAGLGALSSPAVADDEQQVIFEEDFAEIADGELPAGWDPVVGTWEVVDGRLVSSTGTDAARIGFGPEVAPENFRLELSAEFVDVENAARWMNIGVDYDAEEHWGTWVGLRSGTAADNGVEYLYRRPPSGGNVMSVFPGPFDMGTGEAHDIVVEVQGNILTFSMGGEEVFTVDHFVRHGAGFGFRFSRASVAFDDIRITELPQAATAPSEPTDLRVSESGSSATLTWEPPQDPGADARGEAAEVNTYEVAAAPADVPVEELEWHLVTDTSHTVDLPGDSEQFLRVRAINSLGLTGPAALAYTMYGAETVDGYKLRLENGPWQTSHVQGIAVDPENEFIYYSFTTLLVKTDFAGNIIGTVGGFTGHLGDLDFNPEDGRVYGSLEYKAEEVFYAAIFDVDQIDRVGMEAQDSDVLSTVYLDEVTQDYIADMDGDGSFDGNTADTADHRYGASGFDGVAFGPEFGSVEGANLFTLAYGIYENLERTDNDHQVLLQYDTSDWAQYERPLSETDPHTEGPEAVDGKYFVFTGNTRYGVQNLEYDPVLERWFMAVYRGSKPQFPNYDLFAVDAADAPEMGELRGVDGEEGLLLPLAQDGVIDPATGLRGWNQYAAVGFQSLDNGLFYIAEATTEGARGAGAILHLQCWTGDAEAPFALVADGDCPELPDDGDGTGKPPWAGGPGGPPWSGGPGGPPWAGGPGGPPWAGGPDGR